MPKLFNTAFFLLLFAASCTKTDTLIQTTSKAQISSKAVIPKHYIGENYGGGIIFYLDSVTGGGLIAAPENQNSGIAWSVDSSHVLTGAKGTGIGTGSINTSKIIASMGTDKAYAALLCINYYGGGYTDWFLPSKEELRMLSLQKRFIPGLTGGNYWSSSERDSATAYFIHFHNNYKYSADKSDTFHVRAIRSFLPE